MPSRLTQLTTRIRDLEEALESELGEKRKELRYRLVERRVIFENDVKARHRAAVKAWPAILPAPACLSFSPPRSSMR